MALGRIVRIVAERGFGFIKPMDGSNAGEDLFFHASSLQGIAFKDVTLHDRVTFTIAADRRGRGGCALDVERTSPLTKAASAAVTTDHWPVEATTVSDTPADEDDNTYDWGEAS